ncbi:DUF427 domain-containing protein [Litchfieldella rifensis]|uniref:DUF427 domain-containing protein n=1 Tax=Litchfieldella rifensis TaxID=762643 RepID=A0ABV7LVQ5_9GAMM
MAMESSEPRITLHPHHRRVQVKIGDIELRERGYPPRQYLPYDDVGMERLTRSETVNYCPFEAKLLTSRLAILRMQHEL